MSLLCPVHGSCKPSRRPEAERHSTSPRLKEQEPSASPGLRARPAPPPRALRPRRWMA